MILSGGNRWASEEREGENLVAHLDGSGGNASTSTQSGPAGPCRRSGHEALPRSIALLSFSSEFRELNLPLRLFSYTIY
jgi:hypothetical protein